MTCLEAPAVGALPTDEDYVRQLQDGAIESALTGIVERYGQRVLHFVHGIVRDEHQARDVVQDVFGKLLQKHHQYQAGTNFRAWLFEIARNQALSALRCQKRLPRPVSNLPSADDVERGDLLDTLPAGEPARALEEEEFMAAFAAAVDALPEHYQTVFELCVRQGRPYQEAGRILNLPTGTIAIRIMRARKRLFGMLEKHLGRLRRPPACFQ
jgi:RNA polymerase sigma-70 factor (ECF subfamily)